jgi:hypothetical protein
MNDINKMSQQIRLLEKERDRSWKWFFINLLATFTLIGIVLLLLWFTPLIGEWIAKKMNWLPDSGILTKTSVSWVDQTRLDYIKWISFFFLISILTLLLSWTVFRFRKWSKYQRRIELLEEELKELEKTEKK